MNRTGLAIRLSLVLLSACASTARVKVDSTPIEDIGTGNTYIFRYSVDKDVRNTARSKEATRECATIFSSMGFRVTPKIFDYSKMPVHIPHNNEILVTISAAVFNGEEYGLGSTEQCIANGNTIRCSNQKNSRVLYKKSLVLFFNKGPELKNVHQLLVLTLTPTEGMSVKTIHEMCKAGLSKFPEKMDSVFVDTEITGDD